VESGGDILNIALYSPEQSFLYVYKKEKAQKFFNLKEKNSKITEEIERLRYQNTASSRTPEIDQLLEIKDSGAYTFTFELNDPDTLKNAGLLLITFDPEGIRRVLGTTRKALMGNHLVLFPDGRVFYDS
jgi:two-component system sensor histidine kinase YesM